MANECGKSVLYDLQILCIVQECQVRKLKKLKFFILLMFSLAALLIIN